MTAALEEAAPRLDREPRAPRAPGVVRDLFELARLAAPRAASVSRFAAITLAASAALLGSLVAFNQGFAALGVAGADAAPAPWLEAGRAALGLPPDVVTALAFAAFVLLSLAAAGLEHAAWLERLRLLSGYEADLVVGGLHAIWDLDPRERGLFARRDLVLAVRSDCRAARGVFQMLLLSGTTLVQVGLPIAYLVGLDAPMAALALALLLLGVWPVLRLARTTAGLSQQREEETRAVRGEVAALVDVLQREPVTSREVTLSAVREAIESQHGLWRRQFELRSLAHKVPVVLSLAATFALAVWGAVRVQAGQLGWAELLTFVIAARVIFTPTSALGLRAAKAAEQLPRARRQLAFLRQARASAARAASAESVPVPAAGPKLASLVARGLRLPGAGAPSLDLALAPGSLLAIVDPQVSLANPLLQWLTGERYVREGEVRWNGADLNALRHASLRPLVAWVGAGAQTPPAGPLREALARAAPGASEASHAAFARAVLGDALVGLPAGLDSDLGDAGARRRRIPAAAQVLLAACEAHARRPGLVVCDAFELTSPAGRRALAGFARAFRDERITLWIDTEPRPELGPQQIAVFERGVFAGLGDLAWFEASFPNWGAALAAETPRPLPEHGADEDDEELEEELMDEDV